MKRGGINGKYDEAIIDHAGVPGSTVRKVLGKDSRMP
jgi:hypothetical protein